MIDPTARPNKGDREVYIRFSCETARTARELDLDR